MIFLIAVFLFGARSGTARIIAFPLIWAALVICTASMLRQTRGRATIAPPEPEAARVIPAARP